MFVNRLSVKLHKLKDRLTPDKDIRNKMPGNNESEVNAGSENPVQIVETPQFPPKYSQQQQVHHQDYRPEVQRYRKSTNPEDYHSAASIHSRPYYSPAPHEFTNLNPTFTYAHPSPIQPVISYPNPIYPAPNCVFPNYSNVTSTQFDRIASGVSRLNLQSTQHSGYRTELNEPLMRRDNEIDRLKMRIVMLEQHGQVDSKSLTHGGSSSNNSEQKLNQLEYETSMLRQEMSSNLSREDQLNNLDQALNQKEFEIQEQQKSFKLELDQQNQELLKARRELSNRDENILKIKAEMLAALREADKFKSKFNEQNEYIAKLPTLDEVASNQNKHNEMQGEQETLQIRIKDLEKKVLRAKEYVKEKSREEKKMQENLEKSNQETDKWRLEFEEYKRATQNVGELMERCTENASIRAEFELAKNFIIKLEEKEIKTSAKNEAALNEQRDLLKQEEDVSEGLRSKLSSSENQCKDLQYSLKSISVQHQTLMHESLELKEKCRSYELMLSADTTQLLHVLFRELNACSADLDELVANCIDIHSGKQIEISKLLGYSDRVSYSNAQLANNITETTGLINNEFIKKRINEIKQSRSKLTDIRKMVSDEYAEKLGANMSCATQ